MQKFTLISMIRTSVLMMSVTSCATTVTTYEDATGCPAVLREYIGEGSPNPAIDGPNERAAVDGCVRNYGPGACLIRLLKYGPQDYMATCRRKQK